MLIIAYPDALNTFSSLEEARAAAHEIQTIRHVKIYEIREIEHWCPSGPRNTPTDPGPPGTPADMVAEAKAA